MATGKESEQAPNNRTTVERRSDRELVAGALDGPARVVFDAWAKPELLKRWCGTYEQLEELVRALR